MNWMAQTWTLDPRCVLPRGAAGSFDDHVVGDPCIVWDDRINSWRMFYFAATTNDVCSSACAVARSAEEIGSGHWRKTGQISFTNPRDLYKATGWHKPWIVLDPARDNQAATIDGRYWLLWSSTSPGKVIQAAWSQTLAGPWTIVKEPLLVPSGNDASDGLNCDTPSAYWFADRGEVLIYYMAYPKVAQAGQPGAFRISDPGSTVDTRPVACGPCRASPRARQRAGVGERLAGRLQLLHDEQIGWYALLNASPTSPDEAGNREPAPSLGGWAVCRGDDPTGPWQIDRRCSPLRHPAKTDQPRAGGRSGCELLAASPAGHAGRPGEDLFQLGSSTGPSRCTRWILHTNRRMKRTHGE